MNVTSLNTDGCHNSDTDGCSALIWDPAIGAANLKAGQPDSEASQPDSAGLAEVGLLGVLCISHVF